MNLLSRLFPALRKGRPVPVPPRPAPPPPTAPVGDDRIGFLSRLTLERAKAGLPPMQPDAQLDAMAQGWADQMARSGVMSHGDFMARMQRTYPNTAGAENVAAGQRDA